MNYGVVFMLMMLGPSTIANAGDITALRKGPAIDRLLAGTEQKSSEKSSKVAFMLSMTVPGLGEFYTGARKRGAVFLALEAFTWFNYARWRSTGNNRKAEFRKYADLYWNEGRYREWQAYNQSQGSPYNETETLPCKGNEVDLSGCEKVDTQQYYEMIGKYDQFVFGWDDVSNIPISMINTDVTSNQRIGYEDQRNDSNKLLKRASVILGVSVLNRVVSAIHASALARSLQRDTAVSFSVIDPQLGWMPTMLVTRTF